MSIRIGSGRDRITGDSGALTGRELLRRSGVARFLAEGLPDKRDGCRIRHSQRRLARTLLLLAGQGRRDHSDATELRDDPALRLATGDRAGTAPLGKDGQGGGPPGRADERRLPGLVVHVAPQEHYRGREIRNREKGVDPFACNQVRLLLAGFGYQIMHVQRALLERATGTGWSLRRLAERVLRTPARFTASGRRITMTTGGASAPWRMLARGLATLHGPSG